MNRIRIPDLLPPALYRLLRRFRAPTRPGLDGLDTRLEAYLEVGHPGFFVEIGANDGYLQSNTWFLEKEFGWHGILIEPSSGEFVRLLQNRSTANHFFCAACVDFDYQESLSGCGIRV